MGQTLSHGVYLPNEGERNCYAGLASNWQILNTAVGNIAEKAPLVHTHGNISNDGKVGTTANLPLITGTGGAVQAGSFGTSANTFCEGNDSRLSDARTPVAHTHTKSDVTDLFNSNFIPSANNSYDLGSSSYQWNNLYAKNYYYNGVAWGLDKTNEWTRDQTYSTYNYGQMIWLKNTGLDLSINGNTGLSDTYQQMINWVDKNNTVYSSIQSWTASSETTLVLRSKYRTDANTVRDLSVRFTSTATNKVIYPETDADTDLGTSSRKWKTLNGINPGALSLPNLANDGYIDLSDYISANTEYSYTPTVDGWLALYVQTTGFHAENAVGIFTGGGQSNSYIWACSVTSAINLPRASKYHGAVMLPVKAGIPYLCWITINSSTTLSSKRLYFYKATGNV